MLAPMTHKQYISYSDLGTGTGGLKKMDAEIMQPIQNLQSTHK